MDRGITLNHYSMTQARNELSALVRKLNARHHIELTRYGKPVAVLMSMSAYQRVVGPRLDFWEAYQAFLRSHPLEQLAIEPDVFDDVRDTSTGREVRF
jgi:prevent-host-death family protein